MELVGGAVADHPAVLVASVSIEVVGEIICDGDTLTDTCHWELLVTISPFVRVRLKGVFFFFFCVCVCVRALVCVCVCLGVVVPVWFIVNQENNASLSCNQCRFDGSYDLNLAYVPRGDVENVALATATLGPVDSLDLCSMRIVPGDGTVAIGIRIYEDDGYDVRKLACVFGGGGAWV